MTANNSNIKVAHRTIDGRERFIITIPVYITIEQSLNPDKQAGGINGMAATELLFAAQSLFWSINRVIDASDCLTKAQLSSQLGFLAQLGEAATSTASEYLSEYLCEERSRRQKETEGK